MLGAEAFPIDSVFELVDDSNVRWRLDFRVTFGVAVFYPYPSL